MALDAPGFLGEPFDEGGAIADLAACLVERLALFRRQDERKILDVLEHQRMPGFEQGGPFGMGLLLPGAIGGGGRLDGRTGLGGAHVRHGADHGLGGWIDHVDIVA